MFAKTGFVHLNLLLWVLSLSRSYVCKFSLGRPVWGSRQAVSFEEHRVE